ncbi:TAL2 protein, partial [Amia calva]|nr:TAL2 protein [Amia calva]
MSTLLFAVKHNGYAQLGPPPADDRDKFEARAKHVGYLKGFSHILFSPDGTMFAVRGADIYCGPPPSDPKEDWLEVKAKCVGKADWNQFRLLFFHPDGMLYAITKEEKLFKGPPPDDIHVSWLSSVATKLGNGRWDFLRVFFDPQGMMYAVTKDGQLLKRRPPSNADDDWLKSRKVIGLCAWGPLTYFMGISKDGNLWCVSDYGGEIYCAPPPKNVNVNWIGEAQGCGRAYQQYEILAFTEDKSTS